MYTCNVCGEEYTTGQGLHCHSRSHKYDHVILTDLQRQVIFGSLLGDMSIGIMHNRRNPKITVGHSTKQIDYLMWKYNILENLIGSKPHTSLHISNFGSNYKKLCYAVSFQTLSFPCLIPIYKLVHKDENKYITKEWLNEISDPMGLAVWYMDDGSSTNKYTVSFALGLRTEEECFTLKDWMLNKWDIDSRISNQRSYDPKYSHHVYSTLSISSKSNLRKFRDLVEPYIIPSMRYKIDKLNYL